MPTSPLINTTNADPSSTTVDGIHLDTPFSSADISAGINPHNTHPNRLPPLSAPRTMATVSTATTIQPFTNASRGTNSQIIPPTLSEDVGMYNHTNTDLANDIPTAITHHHTIVAWEHFADEVETPNGVQRTRTTRITTLPPINTLRPIIPIMDSNEWAHLITSGAVETPGNVSSSTSLSTISPEDVTNVGIEEHPAGDRIQHVPAPLSHKSKSKLYLAGQRFYHFATVFGPERSIVVTRPHYNTERRNNF